MSDDGHVIEAAFGFDRADYDPRENRTDVAIPLRLHLSNVDEAGVVCGQLLDALEVATADMPAVEHITNGIEAAFCLIANAANALGHLSPGDRARILAAAPEATVALQEALTVWVVDHPSGEVWAVDGPDLALVPLFTPAQLERRLAEGSTAYSDARETVTLKPRVASLEDLRAITVT